MKTQIGMNVAYTSRQSTNFAIKNLMYCSSFWVGTKSKWADTELDLDAKGWVKNLPHGVKAVKLMATTSSEYGHPTGKYHVFYEGKGKLNYRYDCKLIESNPGHDILQVDKSTEQGFRLELTETNTSDYIRNIRFVHEDNLDYETDPFGKEWLEKIGQFPVLRYNCWQSVNGNPIKTWDERSTFENDSWFGLGVPLELIIELTKRTGNIPWIHIPHLADADYIEKCARLIKDNYDGEFYLEPSNEYWNSAPAFTQTHYAKQMGKQMFPDAKSPWHSYVAYRCEEVFGIFDKVFGASKDRVVGVVGCHVEDVRFAEGVLDALGNPKQKGLDAIGVAPYFGIPEMYNPQAENWTLDQLFQQVFEGGLLEPLKPWHESIRKGSLFVTKENLEKSKKVADKNGLRLLGYEGGQHFIGGGKFGELSDKANEDPRMGDALYQYLQDWDEVAGDLLCLFTFVQKGWGLAPHIKSLEQSHKYKAVIKFMESPDSENPNCEEKMKQLAEHAKHVKQALEKLIDAIHK